MPSWEQREGHQDISCAAPSGPPSYLHSRRCPHRLRNHSPLTMVAPGMPTDCTPASWHVGSHRRARLPRLAPKSMLGAAGAGGPGRRQTTTGLGPPHHPLGTLRVRNNTKNKQTKKAVTVLVTQQPGHGFAATGRGGPVSGRGWICFRWCLG